MKYKLSIVVLFIGIALNVCADEVVFTAKAPSQAVVGQPFQLSYTVNQQSSDIQTPEFTNFDVLAGPYTSTQVGSTYVNGQYTSSFAQTYTYTLSAQKAGTFTISPATVKVNGKRVQSNGVKIEVLPAEKKTEKKSSSPATSASGVSNDDLFVRTIITKTKVHEQEAFMLTYRVYFANVEGIQLTNNITIPDFKGFLKQELDQDTQQQSKLESYNGRNYQVADLYRCVLFPQHSGDIEIEPASFDFVAQIRVLQRVHSFFEDYMYTYVNVPKTVKAQGATIHVDPLPSGKPAGFSGGVGNFTFTPTISATEVSENDAVTIKITVSGEGNMKMIQTPEIYWPEGFEAYDPKVTNNYSLTSTGFKGSKTFEYLAISRNHGTYTVPSVSFSYFDTKSKSYKTFTTPDYTIQVKRAAGEAASGSQPSSAVVNYTQKEDVKQLDTDIRYIETSNKGAKSNGEGFIVYGSMEFWLCYLLPLGIALIVLIILRKQIKENADLARVRYKHANKVAKKRLKAAHLALKANDKDHFYEEIERAAWTYLSDRLSIPTADLNKENITSLLQQKNVRETCIAEVMQVLETAAFARYAPSTDHEMEDLYRNTTNMINHLEDEKL